MKKERGPSCDRSRAFTKPGRSPAWSTWRCVSKTMSMASVLSAASPIRTVAPDPTSTRTRGTPSTRTTWLAEARRPGTGPPEPSTITSSAAPVGADGAHRRPALASALLPAAGGELGPGPPAPAPAPAHATRAVAASTNTPIFCIGTRIVANWTGVARLPVRIAGTHIVTPHSDVGLDAASTKRARLP